VDLVVLQVFQVLIFKQWNLMVAAVELLVIERKLQTEKEDPELQVGVALMVLVLLLHEIT
jgi:hypothetical protein